ncbi:MAG: hypothetical protein GYA22_13295 [Bacteroidales bacterium]|nr:hypothetical protein [Bacteroidales bacterium]
MNTPDFGELEKVLIGETPIRPVLFEFFLNDKLYNHLTGRHIENCSTNEEKIAIVIEAFRNAGYDYVTLPCWFTDTLKFESGTKHKEASISLNAGSVITDRASFEAYPWPDPNKGDYGIIERIANYLPDGMKFIGHSDGGVLENAIALVGFERLCFMIYEDEDLTKDIFDAIGSRLLRHYELLCRYPSIGACIVNDDWGFKTQTMLPPDVLRKFVFPWYKEITAFIHRSGKPVILHSCGNLAEVMDDIIDYIGVDAKHSFEDAILPIEQAYELYSSRISLLGGVDMDFLARGTPAEIKARAVNLLKLTADKGKYALGSGNSIPEYVPFENYFAMINAVKEIN